MTTIQTVRSSYPSMVQPMRFGRRHGKSSTEPNGGPTPNAQFPALIQSFIAFLRSANDRVHALRGLLPTNVNEARADLKALGDTAGETFHALGDAAGERFQDLLTFVFQGPYQPKNVVNRLAVATHVQALLVALHDKNVSLQNGTADLNLDAQPASLTLHVDASEATGLKAKLQKLSEGSPNQSPDAYYPFKHLPWLAVRVSTEPAPNRKHLEADPFNLAPVVDRLAKWESKHQLNYNEGTRRVLREIETALIKEKIIIKPGTLEAIFHHQHSQALFELLFGTCLGLDEAHLKTLKRLIFVGPEAPPSASTS